MESKEKIGHGRLLELLDYSEHTGLFTRKSGRCDGEIAGSLKNHGYLDIKVERRCYLAHRLAWFYVYGIWPNSDIDHKDGIRTNNRIQNLREATKQHNAQNKKNPRIDNASGFLGVVLIRCRGPNKFQARIGHKGISHYLGVFKTPEEAQQAYLFAKRNVHSFCTI